MTEANSSTEVTDAVDSSKVGPPIAIKEMPDTLIEAVRRGRYRQAKLLVEAKTPIDEVDARGETALIICCTHLDVLKTRTVVLQLLLDSGADPNIRDKQGKTAIMHATILGQPDTVLALLHQPGTDLELQDLEGNTALMYAAAFGHEDIVSLLLDQMGRLRQVLHLSQRNYAGKTALELAEQNGHLSVAKMLGSDRLAFTKFNTVGFPDPKQLDRGPTPLLSFPIRWRRQSRQLSRRQFKETESDEADGQRYVWQTTEVVKESEGKGCMQPIQRRSIPTCSLPRLALTDNNAATLEPDTRPEAYEEKSWSVDVARLHAPLSRHSRTDPGNSGKDTRLAANDEFQKVLNLLDASIEADPASARTMRDRSESPPLRFYHTQSLQGRRFPPIRPICTTNVAPQNPTSTSTLNDRRIPTHSSWNPSAIKR